MDAETSCPSCYGTGTFPGPLDTRPDYPVHAYEVVCGCGIFLENPAMARLGYQRGQILPQNQHKLAIARAAGYAAWVDEPLVADIELLWTHGIETFSSCQGSAPGYPDKFIIVQPAAKAAEARKLLPWVASVTDRGGDARLSAKPPDGETGDGLHLEWVNGAQTYVPDDAPRSGE
jgi:hypothetical protein